MLTEYVSRALEAANAFARKAVSTLLLVACSIAVLGLLTIVIVPPYIASSAAYVGAMAVLLGISIPTALRTPATWRPVAKRIMLAAFAAIVAFGFIPWHLDRVEEARTPEQKARRAALLPPASTTQESFDWGKAGRDVPPTGAAHRPQRSSSHEECLAQGRIYYRDLGSYPRLSTGESADLKIETTCRYNPNVFQ